MDSVSVSLAPMKRYCCSTVLNGYVRTCFTRQKTVVLYIRD